jgi:hypothetical protein
MFPDEPVSPRYQMGGLFNSNFGFELLAENSHTCGRNELLYQKNYHKMDWDNRIPLRDANEKK